MELIPIGAVQSSLVDRAAAPKQSDEGAPPAWLVLDERFAAGLEGVAAGDELLVLTWLHEGDREVLRVRPRDDPDRPERGVFSTRSSDRPNPIGLHRVTVLGIDGPRVQVDALEAVDGTPVLDLKPVLRTAAER
jgi:tRNA-Thr(GGU) m(6)t(6)A37 methyltransferase TsaA